LETTVPQMVQGHAIGRVEAAARAATSATLAERKIFPKPFVNHAVNSRVDAPPPQNRFWANVARGGRP